VKESFHDLEQLCLRVLILSDLHLEHQPIWLLRKLYSECDLVVAAGDFDSPLDGTIRWLSTAANFRGAPIAYVPGNHEYYGRGSPWQWEARKGEDAARGTNVMLGDGNQVFYLGNVRILMATLWTDYRLNGDRHESMILAQRGLNDHRMILDQRPDGTIGRFSTADALRQHMLDYGYFERNLAIHHDGPTICVSHHGVGGMLSVPLEYHGPSASDRALNPAFSSDLSELILKYNPELWIHGHCHGSIDCMIGSTRIIANPKGYGPMFGGRLPENKDFIDELIVELPLRPAPTMGVK
jgi:hypothetical protein